MQQQEMDFGVFATAAANHARRRNSRPEPDADGLFDAEGVAIICDRRQCHFEVAGELFGTVQFKEASVPLTAIAPGRWDPVAALSACTKAHGNRAYEVDYAAAKPTNPGGLDEIGIARVVGADGLRPYLSKKGRYFEAAYGVWAPVEQLAERPCRLACRHTERFAESLLRLQRPLDGFAPDGRHRFTGDYRALRGLEDAGLVRIELGPRGGMATAKVTWLPRAYLAPERLAKEDEAAMEMLA